MSLPAASDAPAPGASTTPPPGALDVEIRRVRTLDELHACVELQEATWGDAFSELVPATILKVTQRIGGVTAGAFARDGTLLGFVFGMTGVERGTLVHWSDMLAVRAGAQNHGIGRRLKEFQREALREIGVARMYWTYDPLVARNAHFNITRLGARVSDYVQDMYGADTGSTLHRGLGTDRFVVSWPVAEPSPLPLAPPDAVRHDAPVINDAAHLRHAAATRPPAVRIEIPFDIFAELHKAPAQGAAWRTSTRRAFLWAMDNGYVVDHFEHGDARSRAYYVLVDARTERAAGSDGTGRR